VTRRGYLGSLLAGAFVLSSAPPAAAGLHLGEVVRPTEGGALAYTAPTAKYAAGRTVVHWATHGEDAPPQADRDGDEVPDFVECVARAADAALSVFQRTGFRAPSPDRGGPSRAPDIYMKNLYGRGVAAAVPPTRAAGGAFVVVSSLPLGRNRCPRRAVAHETFHLVMWSYDALNAFPLWFSESAAAAMQLSVFPSDPDPVLPTHIQRWLQDPSRSLVDTSSPCARCYSGALWWRYVYERTSLLRPLLAALGRRGRRQVRPLEMLDRLARQAGTSFRALYSDFAVDLLENRSAATARARVALSSRGRTYSGRLAPTAIEYVELDAEPQRSFRIRVASAAAVRIVVLRRSRLTRDLRLAAGRARTVRLRADERAVLVLAAGLTTIRYRVVFQN
jgi:hypothetical protein